MNNFNGAQPSQNNTAAPQTPSQPAFTQPGFDSTPSTNLFSKVGEDDGIDVPVFLRRKDK